ncbi:holo-[acyl-carrier protein] synthase [Nitrosomonas eutropha]|uniref:holo-ACP synthase n=1 Tax=Nitrosomonas eutropha TaxID=916 RepID=UPI000881FD13|nr:holo-ACP synthase [Nitrosomonas eutropha]SCX24961.1 holo-[acyl-carrier protein] synthase [Nitrosomonas eutropha]SDW97760.1 holo-[acyl-carrier protein] synthase [Nitrosomonas eutropha]
MIYGIGTDLVDPARIAGSLERYGERFARRVLADSEWSEYVRQTRPEVFLAKRFAAKEAFSKAVGTGLRAPVMFGNIAVQHDTQGKPYFEFHQELIDWIGQRGIVSHHLSISDELTLASAFVVLEK